MFIFLPIVLRLQGKMRIDSADIYARLYLFNIIRLCSMKVEFEKEGMRIHWLFNTLIPYKRLVKRNSYSLLNYGLKLRIVDVITIVNLLDNAEHLLAVSASVSTLSALSSRLKPVGMVVNITNSLSLNCPTQVEFSLVYAFSIVRLIITLIKKALHLSK